DVSANNERVGWLGRVIPGSARCSRRESIDDFARPLVRASIRAQRENPERCVLPAIDLVSVSNSLRVVGVSLTLARVLPLLDGGRLHGRLRRPERAHAMILLPYLL